MLNINIVCVGRLKEEYLKLAVNEYTKRLSKYCNINIIELQDEKLPDKINDSIKNEIKNKECKKIVNAIKRDSYIIAMDIGGKQYTSEDFSKKIDDIAVNLNSSITFIIGGTLGLNDEVLDICNEKISFSKMTFPHQVFRVLLLEQVFRAFKISKNETYHW